ncbi:hypothetical protein BJ742DRAFT_332660 [Cladochytrium replicatum]|nr:hypothetical protein BJ742DRAFT_332660 [Cladochytrium replicatum]
MMGNDGWNHRAVGFGLPRRNTLEATKGRAIFSFSVQPKSVLWRKRRNNLKRSVATSMNSRRCRLTRGWELLTHQISEFVAGVDLKKVRKQVSADEKHLEALWADQKNWTLGVFYHCVEDPRFFVPKNPPGFGWTINMSKKSPAATKWKEENNVLRGALREQQR